MKKTYEPPMAATIELGMLKLIAAYIPGKPNKEKDDDEWADSYDTNEYRSDWETFGPICRKSAVLEISPALLIFI